MAPPFSQSYTARSVRARSFAILFAVWLLTQFWGIFSPPLLDDADSVHVEAVREMVLRHDYVTLYADGIRYFDKPPLPYWMGAASAHIFGLKDWAIRLPLALSVLLLTFWIYALAARLNYREEQPERGDWAGLFSGLAFATAVGPYLFTRFFIPDVIVALWLTIIADLTLRMVDSVDKHGRAKWWQSVAFGLVCAGCTLTKGLIGVVFPLAILIWYLLVTAQLKKLWRMRLGLGTGTFFAAAVPWHWLIAVRNPATSEVQKGWFWFYFINDQLNRYLNKRIPRDYDKVPFVLFWLLLLVWLMPWGVWLPASARRGWRLLRSHLEYQKTVITTQAEHHNTVMPTGATPQSGSRSGGTCGLSGDEIRSDTALTGPGGAHIWPKEGEIWGTRSSLARYSRVQIALRSPQTLFVLWALAILVFFSFSTRQEYYTIPAVPPLCLLAGWFLAREREREPWTRRPGMICAVAFAAVAAVAGGACLYFAVVSRTPPAGTDLYTELQRHPEDYALSFGHFFDLTRESLGFFRLPLLGTAAGLLGGAGLAVFFRLRRRFAAANLSLAAGMVLVLACAHQGLRVFYPILGSEPLAPVIRQHWQPGARIVIDGEYTYASSLNFYTGETLSMLNGRVNGLWYGSLFPDAPHRFEDDSSFAALWRGPGQIFFVTSHPEKVAALLAQAGQARVLAHNGDKLLISNR